MNVRTHHLINKAAQSLGMQARRVTPVEDEIPPFEEDAMDRAAKQYGRQLDEALQEIDDYVMGPHRDAWRDRYGSRPGSYVGETGQLQLDMEFNPNQSDLFAGVGR